MLPDGNRAQRELCAKAHTISYDRVLCFRLYKDRKVETMKCYEIMEKLEQLSPVSFAESWDNVGLLVGSRDKEIQSVLLALDATDAVIDQAVLSEADMILTHHPMIFSGMKRIVAEDFTGKRIIKLISNDINCYAMHTNFDVMGMADEAADQMHLSEREVLEITFEDEISKEGIGRIGFLEKEMTLRECADYVKEVFDLESIRMFGDGGRKVKKAAIVPGSGKDYVSHAVKMGADVLITGDIGHHDGIDAMEQGLSVLDAGHFGLEKIFISYMKDFISREMPEIRILEARQQAPFEVI